jgi:hypothetical protein
MRPALCWLFVDVVEVAALRHVRAGMPGLRLPLALSFVFFSRSCPARTRVRVCLVLFLR